MSREASREVVDYLTFRYKRAGLLPRAPSNVSGWDPYIYPGEGHIPFCSVCESDYNTFRQNNKAQPCDVEFSHNASCLWEPYFAERVRRLNPRARVIVKRRSDGPSGKKLPSKQ
jgi:hypothetical protein